MPCPILSSPVNGEIFCSDKTVVVGSNCSFVCNEGYQLQGSQSRVCLPDTSWSGLQTECRVMECPNLVAPQHSTIVQSCSSIINSTCFLSCIQDYYHENGVLFEQTCLFKNGIAKWSEATVCKGKRYIYKMNFSFFKFKLIRN